MNTSTGKETILSTACCNCDSTKATRSSRLLLKAGAHINNNKCVQSVPQLLILLHVAGENIPNACASQLCHLFNLLMQIINQKTSDEFKSH